MVFVVLMFVRGRAELEARHVGKSSRSANIKRIQIRKTQHHYELEEMIEKLFESLYTDLHDTILEYYGGRGALLHANALLIRSRTRARRALRMKNSWRRVARLAGMKGYRRIIQLQQKERVLRPWSRKLGGRRKLRPRKLACLLHTSRPFLRPSCKQSSTTYAGTASSFTRHRATAQTDYELF